MNKELYKQRWQTRYEEPQFAYGKEPNEFFKQYIEQFTTGNILLPADGEGRNGVYAAGLGWQVVSCDLSESGKTKALMLADERNVTIDYLVGDIEDLELKENSFDAIALIYAHFLPEQKRAIHAKLNNLLKSGGVLIFEAFSNTHIQLKKANPKVGGPSDVAMTYNIAEIENFCNGFDFMVLREETIELNEGAYHCGTGSVIRCVAKKR